MRKKDLQQQLSKMARKDAGCQIYRLQEGFDPKDRSPCMEWVPVYGLSRIHAENEYRIIYVVQLEEALYILHSFVKKTQKTPHRDLELARERLNQVLKERRA